MKELRPPSGGRTEIRTLFVLDPWRSATLLVTGDKGGAVEPVVSRRDTRGGGLVRDLPDGT